jgi:hypothetical protein
MDTILHGQSKHSKYNDKKRADTLHRANHDNSAELLRYGLISKIETKHAKKSSTCYWRLCRDYGIVNANKRTLSFQKDNDVNAHVKQVLRKRAAAFQVAPNKFICCTDTAIISSCHCMSVFVLHAVWRRFFYRAVFCVQIWLYFFIANFMRVFSIHNLIFKVMAACARCWHLYRDLEVTGGCTLLFQKDTNFVVLTSSAEQALHKGTGAFGVICRIIRFCRQMILRRFDGADTFGMDALLHSEYSKYDDKKYICQDVSHLSIRFVNHDSSIESFLIRSVFFWKIARCANVEFIGNVLKNAEQTINHTLRLIHHGNVYSRRQMSFQYEDAFYRMPSNPII